MKTAVHTAMVSSAVLCALLMLLGLFGSRLLLEWINTPAEILDDFPALPGYLYLGASLYVLL